MSESHLVQSTSSGPEIHRAPGIGVRGVPVLLQCPDHPCQESDGHSPISGSLCQGWGAAAPPQPWGTSGSTAGSIQHLERMGWVPSQGLHPALVSPHDLGQALPFWVHHTQSPQEKEVPGRNAPAEISPRRNSQRYRAATEPGTGTETPDLLPAGNVVRAWTELNQSRA